MTNATVDIKNVFKNATRIPVTGILITDKVFDVFGGTYSLKSVRTNKNEIRIIRNDGVWSWFPKLDYDGKPATITVIRNN